MKTYQIRCLAVMVIAMVSNGMVYPAPVIGGPDDSLVSFSVETRQILGALPGSTPISAWRICVVRQNGLPTKISFCLEASTTPAASLLLDSSGHIEASPEIAGGNIFQGDGIFLSVGIPMPCNLLPVAELSSRCPMTMSKYLEKKISGQSFACQVELTCVPVSMEEGLRNGWVRDLNRIQGSLKMISAFNKATGQLLTRQLWDDADGWWLYEESVFYKSWRVIRDN